MTTLEKTPAHPVVVERHANGVGWIITADTPEQARELYNKMLDLFDGESGYGPQKQTQPETTNKPAQNDLGRQIAIRKAILAKTQKGVK